MTDDLFKKALEQTHIESEVFVNYSFEIADWIANLMQLQKLDAIDLSAKISEIDTKDIHAYLSGTHNFTLKELAALEIALGKKMMKIL